MSGASLIYLDLNNVVKHFKSKVFHASSDTSE